MLLGLAATGQTLHIQGYVRDSIGNGIEMTQIAVKELPQTVTYSKPDGSFYLTLPGVTKPITLVISNINYFSQLLSLSPQDTLIKLNIRLRFKNQLKDVIVTDKSLRTDGFTTLSPKVFKSLPSATGNLEDLLKTQMGVSSNNELSSGYSVRGGNFDENLIYVNDFELYRPQLARSGQQEGLSFINPLMVQSLRFSPGGFEAQYGDKFSSVLDVRYRSPRTQGSQISIGLLGAQFQTEGTNQNHAFSWNIAGRYRSLNYLFSRLETQGEYRPRAWDLQGFFTYKRNPRWQFESLIYTAGNTYQVVPSIRETNFGTVKDALQLRVYFDGQELLKNVQQLAGFSAIHVPNSKLHLKYMASGYRSEESERTTLQGQYWIDQLETDLSKPNYGQVAFNRGVGTYLQHLRNFLNVSVVQIEHKGLFKISPFQNLKWGAKVQGEWINDQLKEWKMTDSAGFNQPYQPDQILPQDFVSTHNTLSSQRFQSYLQYDHEFHTSDSTSWTLVAGIREHLWSLNQEWLVSPRIQIRCAPNWISDWVFYASTGLYYQAPFYRELRTFSGALNPSITAQQSLQFNLGSDYQFQLWNRPFRLMQAIYYKQFSRLNPYEVDNIRIRYFANNQSYGYAAGYDIRLHGDLVPGAESWINLGLLQTQEKSLLNRHYIYKNASGETIVKGYTFDQIKTDSILVDPGYIPRPTDQLVHLGLFFQDYLPKYPQLKFNMTLQFGSGLPFGPPQHERWLQVLRMPPYRRVDAGFAYSAIGPNQKLFGKFKTHKLKELSFFLELFNLLQISNVASYTWIQDVTGNRYAVPNYLTNRTLNLRMFAVF